MERKARVAQDPTIKATFLEIARRWQLLADEYEDPDPPIEEQ